MKIGSAFARGRVKLATGVHRLHKSAPTTAGIGGKVATRSLENVMKHATQPLTDEDRWPK